MSKESTKQNILNAALAEFASKSYHEANTNTIAKKAGVSKGSIFLHYKSKKELYLSCLKNILIANFNDQKLNQIAAIEDVFDRVIAITKWKIDRFKKYPEEYIFVYKAMSSCSAEIRAEVLAIIAEFSKQAKNIYLFNTSKSYGKYTSEEVFVFIQVISDGFEKRLRNDANGAINKENIDKDLLMFLEIMEVLKKGLTN